MPRGHAKNGHRIVNSRTEKQRANKEAYQAQAPVPGRGPDPNGGLPAESWWIKARDRASFSQLAAHEHDRMKVSAFGQTKLTAGE